MQRAKDFLERAERALDDARRSKYDKYAVSILRSQECIELSIKATVLGIGEKYTTIHDVSEDLIRFRNKFPKEFQEKIPRFALWSRIIDFIHKFAKYGYESAGAAAGVLFDEHDADLWVAHAEEVLSTCKQLI